MADPTSAAAALKTRIINHMNADHSRSLYLYARHYNGVPSRHARTAVLTDITPTHLTLSTSYGRHLVPLDPPLAASLSGARERLVAMHHTCLDALGLDDVVVKSYRWPDRAWMWCAGVAVFLVCVTFPFREQLHPRSGSWASWIWSFGGLLPANARLCYSIQPWMLPVVLAIHVGETVGVMMPRLRKYGVEMGSRVWWCWTVDCFFEGVGSWTRLGEMVEEAKGAKKGLVGKEKGEKSGH